VGAKHASIHLRCDDEKRVLERLERKFNKKNAGFTRQDAAAMLLIKAVAGKNIAQIKDTAKKAEGKRILDQVLNQAKKDMLAGNTAVIVVWKHFVSIYWYDHIRVENLSQEMSEYALLCGVPAMGVGLYDDTDFSLYAIGDAGTAKACIHKGEYWFSHDHVVPVEPEAICNTIDAPFLLQPLRETLSCNDGESMANAFEEKTRIPIMLDERACKEIGMKQWIQWENAAVFMPM